jgi:cyclopropane-fatty-acyl-phospholipid synthase
METALKIEGDSSTEVGVVSKAPVTPQRVLEILKRGGVYELGEAYIRGEWESDDIRDLLLRIFTKHSSIGVDLPKISPRFLAYLISDQFGNAQIGKGAYEVAKRHYDLGNDLFSAMLDKTTMTYTCGYWRDASDLEQAQVAKIDLLCRKLYLEPGMKVLDIGCGWGNFAEYAARKYGVSVVGLTVSKEQAALARERCRGLNVEIVLQDYREYSGEFDRVVSIEMIEAVGRKNIPGFFSMAQRCLKPRGLFGLQVISAETLSKSSSVLLDQYILWLRKRIFPNGYIPNFDHIGEPNKHGFIIEDLHNFSADYAKTLYAWAERFKAGWPELEAKYGEPFYRMWLYYLYGCEALFRARMVQLYQVVYSNGGTPGGYSSVR